MQQQTENDAVHPWYVGSADDVLTRLEVDPRCGLSTAEAARRRERYGANLVAAAKPPTNWLLFAHQFEPLVVWILMAAALIAGLMGEWGDAVAIITIVVVNALVGFLQEHKADRALATLRDLAAPMAKARRDGATTYLPAHALVPGDIIELESGDHVPADARLIYAFGLQTQEAALTGESNPVEKNAQAGLMAGAPVGDRKNMIFLGAAVAAGKAAAVVVATGMATELGQIAGLLSKVESDATPLQRRLDQLGRTLVGLCLAIVAIIFALQLLRGGRLLDTLLVSVSLAVAAVPEGLPAVVTLALALGLQRMVKRNALIRRLACVETLGSVSVVCSDKTGTLTRNEMTVCEIIAGHRHYRVTGVGYERRGAFHTLNTAIPFSGANDDTLIDPATQRDLVSLLTVAAECNDASMESDRVGNSWTIVGDPTEAALLIAAEKAGIRRGAIQRRLHQRPFDSERKIMSVCVGRDDGRGMLYVKGAAEIVLGKCSRELRDGSAVALDGDRRRQIIDQNRQLTERALRVLALAYRELDDECPADVKEADLVFCGFAGMIDPARDEAKTAIAKARAAGVRTIMITGDHPGTARAIARQLGIAPADSRILTGEELDAMSDDELAAEVERIVGYARVSAAHKLRVVRAWQSRGTLVAMTGDGVNDAPAIKAADIGIAMGITGSDVTKEASDMVLTDDNFASIVDAIEEGRGIYDDIQKVVHYLLSCNVGEILFMFLAALMGWPIPLLAIQILWINLVTDGLPALALGVESPEPNVMQRPPRPAGEAVLTRRRAVNILFHGLAIAAVTLVGFDFAYQGDAANLPRARAIAFNTLAFAQLFFAFSCRSDHYTLPQLGLFTNHHLFVGIALSGLMLFGVSVIPAMKPIFSTGELSATEWAGLLLLALMPVSAVEIFKIARARMRQVSKP